MAQTPYAGLMTTSGIVWDGLSAEELARRCAAPQVTVLDETDSTLDVAHELAEHGAPPGTVVLADAQRAGRGRQGRPWSSQPGRGVWLTVLQRPGDPRSLDVLSLRVGLCCAQALDGVAGERVGVKWPNDLMLRSGKLGGILTEASWSGSSLGWVAIGVGINVAAPPDVATATGLRPGVARVDVLSAVVGAIRTASARTGVLSLDEMMQFAERDVLAGRRIASPTVGTVVGIDAAGGLVVDTPRGSETLRAGSVRLADEAIPA
ncbi:MAG TPA: biotin--[acetyl-CoA-carboxylase] ligase [Gemmatimonadaceae bacterium]|nr:biotin--[acetyl-CoA-carboxylase] ligase [Gemmatimonadaceae bacterium]